MKKRNLNLQVHHKEAEIRSAPQFFFRQVMRGNKKRRVMGKIKAKKMKYISRVQVGRIMKGLCILQGPSSSSKRVKVSNSFILDEPLLAYEYLLLSSSLH
ncbi:hypothetical protein P5673_019838 [Acropora cervicornis]|uniref:Uncharacterized protein n=1 Tax=Acropora cervicornis TaxID=6130 RepID=A0AAD9QAL3_ACRCE|nr:hypothetical protein P5673_019838 [Acropora cervicornis]